MQIDKNKVVLKIKQFLYKLALFLDNVCKMILRVNNELSFEYCLKNELIAFHLVNLIDILWKCLVIHG